MGWWPRLLLTPSNWGSLSTDSSPNTRGALESLLCEDELDVFLGEVAEETVAGAGLGVVCAANAQLADVWAQIVGDLLIEVLYALAGGDVQFVADIVAGIGTADN